MNLNQITVPSLDLHKSVPFYQKLGLQLIVDAIPDYARYECPEGDATFSIHKVTELPKGDGIYVYFECIDLDERVTTLLKNGIEFDELPKDKKWLWREARLRDLDGNQIILFHGGVNRKNPPWRLTS
ncbi:VOC family protein [Aggregatimonas sangjinii]|uniref:VOC family protein n=1 Tax=Aggregatimonas sangjinii TaxID=2583587 RepID=A0A5B7STJ2_9FLAO|nr:VOC family protein [Aggregatimonas sangjinii]QCX01522.1 VOC family protein [Aggregatimonas sangjinii]